MSRTHLTLALLTGALLSGCGMAARTRPACTSDSDCGPSEICFPEGCGDPGKDIVVEVVPNNLSGHHAQDIELPTLSAQQDFTAVTPMKITAEVSLSTGARVSSPVTLSAVGESLLIPGVTRRFEIAATPNGQGLVELPVGAGKYNVSVSAAQEIPPRPVEVRVDSEQGENVSVRFVFPRNPLTFSGRLLKTYVPGFPPTEIPLQYPMELIALAPHASRSGDVLSQPSLPSTSQSGDFTLLINPVAAELKTFQLLASPRDPSSPVPSKVFTCPYPPETGVGCYTDAVNASSPESSLRLELGDYGELLVGLTGTLLGTDGLPVKGAEVYLEGQVGGGGTYRSPHVETDAEGKFTVDLLPSSPNATYTLYAFPPPESAASILVRSARAVAVSGKVGRLEPDVFTCPDRVPVVGTVLRFDGSIASGVQVKAAALAPIDGHPLPRQEFSAYSDDSGRFDLALDPAVYRLDFLPGEALPSRSRFLTVRAEPAVNGLGMKAIDIQELRLLRSRKVSGFVTAQHYPSPDTSGQTTGGITTRPASYALVRFFHVTSVEGKPASILLGEAITDANGFYTVQLPTR